MRNYLRKVLSGALFGLGIASAFALVDGVYAATVPLISGPAPGADMLATINSAIGSINTNLAAATSMSFVANGAVATTVTSLGPTGSHTTIQEWMQVTDAGGTIRYIPLY